MWVSLNKRLVNTLYPKFFPVNMIFLEEQSLGYNKICMGFNPRGVHGDPCQLPDYIIFKTRYTALELGICPMPEIIYL